MRVFFCRNCMGYREFYEVDGVELCAECGEPLDENLEDHPDNNTDDNEADDNDDLG